MIQKHKDIPQSCQIQIPEQGIEFSTARKNFAGAMENVMADMKKTANRIYRTVSSDFSIKLLTH